MDFQKFSEPGRVVVAYGFGVSEAFQQRGSFEDLLSDEIRRRLVDGRQILHDQLGGFRLPGARFAGDDDHLISSW